MKADTFGNGTTTNLLGELLTLQGVSQSSNCNLTSCFVGKYQIADVVKNGMNADTFGDGTTVKLLFDSGTSKTLTAHKEDFLRMTPLEQACPIQGIGSTVTPVGEGMVRYVVQAVNGEHITIECRAYYVPSMTPEVRLVCPHGLKTLGDKVGCFVNPSREEDPEAEARFVIYKRCKNWQDTKPVSYVSIPYQKVNNLPCVIGKAYNTEKYAFCVPTPSADSTKDLKKAVCLTDHANTNLSAAQKELLWLHYHLGHIGMKHVIGPISLMVRNLQTTIQSYLTNFRTKIGKNNMSMTVLVT